jgi:hypothetical protein
VFLFYLTIYVMGYFSNNREKLIMPTPVNNNNLAYSRQYKTTNALQAGQVSKGDNSDYQLPVKGSIDLPPLPAMCVVGQNDKLIPQHHSNLLGEIIIDDLLKDK